MDERGGGVESNRQPLLAGRKTEPEADMRLAGSAISTTRRWGTFRRSMAARRRGPSAAGKAVARNAPSAFYGETGTLNLSL